MEMFWQLIALVAVIVGTIFSVLGVVGYIRLPDVYTRLHATGKVSVFGVVLLLVAAAVLTPLGFGRAMVLITLVMLAGPGTAHALGSAAYRLSIPLRRAIRDDLARVIIPPTCPSQTAEPPSRGLPLMD